MKLVETSCLYLALLGLTLPVGAQLEARHDLVKPGTYDYFVVRGFFNLVEHASSKNGTHLERLLEPVMILSGSEVETALVREALLANDSVNSRVLRPPEEFADRADFDAFNHDQSKVIARAFGECWGRFLQASGTFGRNPEGLANNIIGHFSKSISLAADGPGWQEGVASLEREFALGRDSQLTIEGEN